MTRAEALRLGPFVGGLNLASDPTAIADTELASCKNFELDIDGSLVCRPPIVETTNNSGTWTERIVIIGRGIFSGGSYLIGSNNDGTYAFNGTTWSTVQANLKSSCALQYGGHIWIIPKPGTKATQNGGRWDPTAGFVADANMPEGQAAVFHKSRLFVCPGVTATTNESRLRFTDSITSSTLSWPGTNIVDVSPGDGENLIDIAVYNDNLLLFKNDSTYVLAYDLRPTDAILRYVNTTLGVTSQRCMVPYENSIFTFHEGNIYELINYDYTRVNIKVPFVLDGAAAGGTRLEEVFICTFGDRLVVRYFNKIYVYNLNTRTWGEWESVNSTLHNFGPLVEMPSNSASSTNSKFYAGSTIQSHENFFVLQDGLDSSTEERTISTTYDITCFMKTKNYDLADSHHFKRMTWWGADLLTTRNITGRANPIVINFQVAWDDVAGLTWNDLATFTWNNPQTIPISLTTNITHSSTAGRIFTKFLKSIRFRQVNFEISMLSNGTTAQGPCRLFTLTAMVASKQTVSKQVN